MKDAPIVKLSTQIRLLWLAALVLSICWGLVSVFGRSPFLPWMFSLTLCLNLTLILRLKSLLNGSPIPNGFLWIIYVTWPIALPIYYAKWHGWRGCLKAVTAVGGLWLFSFLTAWGMLFLLQQMAYRHHVSGRIDKATALYTRLLEVNPSNEWASRNLAIIQEEQRSH